jgi:GAF domain-containing protein
MPSNPLASAGSADITQRALLQSIVETARMVFGAMAASVLLIDRESGDLVFGAVSGEGEESLVGTRFPGGTGIAGWVAASAQPLIVDDVGESNSFSRDAAESTGYVPASIMAAPVIWDGECIGVLEVLDRGARARGDLTDIDVLGLLAAEMAMSLELLIRLDWVKEKPSAEPDAGQAYSVMFQRMAERLPRASEPVATTVARLLTMADQLLADGDSGVGPSGPIGSVG